MTFHEVVKMAATLR